MKNDDFLTELGLNAVVTRLKRVSDAMLHDGPTGSEDPKALAAPSPELRASARKRRPRMPA